jgi:hypothetical protein
MGVQYGLMHHVNMWWPGATILLRAFVWLGTLGYTTRESWVCAWTKRSPSSRRRVIGRRSAPHGLPYCPMKKTRRATHAAAGP